MKTGIALDDLTEDAVSSSVYSFHYHRDPEGHTQTSVILDIQRFEGTEWLCKLATGGWKRICINLVTNALKYTPAGWVHVTLERRAKPGPGRRFDAVLTVADSGKGMSEEFQKNHLFEDFSQEDTLANGLGLGMHMVARIINAMGGKIEVTSNQSGGGTRVTVTVPFENTVDHEDSSVAVSISEKRALAGVNVGIVEVDHATPVLPNEILSTTTRTMAVKSVGHNLTALGIAPERCSLKRHANHDLNVVLDEDLGDYVRTIHDAKVEDRTRRPSILVVCRNNPGAQTLRRAWRENPISVEVTAEFIALPCGLHELKRAIASALKGPNGNTNLVADAEKSTSGGEDPFVSDDKIQLSTVPIDKSRERLSMRRSAPSEHTVMDPSMEDAVVSSLEDAQVPLEQLSMELQETPHSPKNLTTTPQGSTSAAAIEQRPSKPPSTKIPAQPSPAGGPLLLLVDDNSINLQLLIRFAKKHKYQYITAVDGKLAFEAFENAHKESLTSSSSSSASDTRSSVGAPGDGIPTLILMDINMPVVSLPPASHPIILFDDLGVKP